MLDKMFKYLNKVQLDLHFTTMEQQGDNLILYSNTGRVGKIIGLFLAIPFVLLTSYLIQHPTFAVAWFLWLALGLESLALALLFWKAKNKRTFNRSKRMVEAEFSFLSKVEKESFAFEPPSQLVLTGSPIEVVSAKGKARIPFQVSCPEISLIKYISYGDYVLAESFAKNVSNFFRVPLSNSVLEALKQNSASPKEIKPLKKKSIFSA